VRDAAIVVHSQAVVISVECQWGFMFSASFSTLKPRLIQLPNFGGIASYLLVAFALCVSVCASFLTYTNVSGQSGAVRASVINRACQTPHTIRVAVCPAAQSPLSSNERIAR
jgi:hypothetical protein